MGQGILCYIPHNNQGQSLCVCVSECVCGIEISPDASYRIVCHASTGALYMKSAVCVCPVCLHHIESCAMQIQVHNSPVTMFAPSPQRQPALQQVLYVGLMCLPHMSALYVCLIYHRSANLLFNPSLSVSVSPPRSPPAPQPPSLAPSCPRSSSLPRCPSRNVAGGPAGKPLL